DHEHCLKAEETYLPTRVIDCSDPSKPRLVETHRQIKAHYCALSYVWGGEQNQKTTTTNVSTYLREGLPTLPQTIADAVLATHKLGIRYLWVDALCIIQDSNEDKGKELADMGRIYLDAYLALSILSTFRANGGFLPDERAPVALPFYTSTKSDNPECMWLKYCVVYPNPRKGFKTDTTPIYAPLDERAWCLQESTLSPRRLIFQIPYVEYECRSFSESLTKGALQSEGKIAHPMNDYILFPKQASNDDISNIDELRDHWGSILAGYTGCKITVPADKLVALAGVAEIFQSRFNDDYIAGLWRKTLLDDLLWRVFGPGCRPAEYRAPTWSWASVDGSI
ncbi:heterokaryon incompatibility protein-domain-containing protein, partial [Collybia nuda]